MNEREQEKTLARLLARGLRQQFEPGGVECPDAELLAAYHDRALEDAEVTRLDTHFSVCARCQQMLAALALSASELHAVSDVELVPASEENLASRVAAMADMHMAAAAPPAPAAPKVPAAAPALILGSPEFVKPKRRFWSVRWLAPALAAAAAVALWIGLRPNLPRWGAPTTEQENKIASAPTAAVTTSETPAEPPKEIAQNAAQPSPTEALEGHAQRKVDEAAPAPLNEPAAKRRVAQAPEQLRLEGKRLSAEATSAQPTDQKRVTPSAPPGIAAAPGVAISGEKERADQAQEAQKRETELAGAAAAKPGASVTQTVEVTQAFDKSEAGKLAQKPAGVATTAAPAPPPPASKPEESPQKAAKIQGGAAAVTAGPAAAARLRSSMVFPPARVVITTPSPSVLWRVGFAGQIERSRDSGHTWLAQASNVDADLVAGSGPSENVCWVVGRAGTVLRTTDGEHWEKAAPPTTADLIRVTAQDALNATVVAADRQRYATSDGGRSWHSSTN